MRLRVLFALLFAAIVGSVALAQKKPRVPVVPRLDVFSKTAYQIEPQIEAVLIFTDEQKEKLAKAAQETLNAPNIVELRRKKGEPADKAKQARLKEEMTKAREEFKKRVLEILTPEQKATIQKVDGAFQSALDSVLSKEEQKEKLEAAKAKKKK